MRWFKHYNDARESSKLTELIAMHGAKGYGHYWMLLELMAHHWDGYDTKLELHIDTIKTRLGIYHKRLALIYLQSLSDLSLIFSDIHGNLISLDCTILFELQAKDFKYEREKRGDYDPKIKSKNKIKIKSKIPPTPKGADQKKADPVPYKKMVDEFHELCCPPLAKIKMLSSGRKTALIKAIEVLSGSNITWKEYCLKIANTGFLSGSGGTSWKANFDWVLKPANLLKIVEGNYDTCYNESKAQKIQDSILNMENPYAK